MNKTTQFIKQAKTIWLTGLSGSGKSTLACALQQRLTEAGIKSVLLDGDEIRKGVNSDLGFTVKDRTENNRRVAEMARLINQNGLTAIVAMISPTNSIRGIARRVIGTEHFILIHLNTPLEVCEKRDCKNLYKEARTGQINNFTGISSPFEEPRDANYVVNFDSNRNEDLNNILELLNSIKLNKS